MTKREICERLLKIYNSAMFASDGSGDIGGGPCYNIGHALRDLLLDLAAPEEEEPKAEEGNAPSRGIKEQFLALGEKAIKKIDFDKVADAEWEICSDSRERMLSWARGAVEGAVSKVVADGGDAEYAYGVFDATASRKHGRLRIELDHRRTKQHVEAEEEEGEPKSKFPIGHPLHMSTEEMKAADTALFIQTEGWMGKEWRNAEEKKEPPLLIYEEKGEKVPCPVCGAPAAPIKNKPGVFLCKRCGGLVCAEDGK